MSRTSQVTPRMESACSASALRRLANGPPASRQWPISPLVTETNLTWWPLAAHIEATPPTWISQSSGCAPKQMIRNLPSSGGAGAAATPRETMEVSRRGTDERFIRILFVELVLDYRIEETNP